MVNVQWTFSSCSPCSSANRTNRFLLLFLPDALSPSMSSVKISLNSSLAPIRDNFSMSTVFWGLSGDSFVSARRAVIESRVCMVELLSCRFKKRPKWSEMSSGSISASASGRRRLIEQFNDCFNNFPSRD